MKPRAEPRLLTFEFQGHTLRVRSSHGEFLRRVERIFGPFLTERGRGRALAAYRVAGQGPFRLSRGGEALYDSDRLHYVVEYLESDLLSVLIGALDGHLLVHAGAVASEGSATLLPARAGSGKSTLAAALVRAGYAFATDEVAVIGLGDSLLRPFPKALNLKSPSLELLRPLRGDLEPVSPEDPADGERVHHVTVAPPLALSPADALRVDRIVFPRYVPGGTLRLQPVSRAGAIGEIAQLSFNHYRLGNRALDCLENLVRPAACFRLDFANLADAVREVQELSADRALAAAAP